MRLAYYRLLISLGAVCCPLDRKIYTHNYQVGLFIRAHNTVSYIVVGAGKTVCVYMLGIDIITQWLIKHVCGVVWFNGLGPFLLTFFG